MNLLASGFLLVVLLFAGCDGGGGGGSAATPPVDDVASDSAVISGALIVPPNHSLEAEPNDHTAQAQPVSMVQKVAGAAAASDPGLPLAAGGGIVVQDLFRLEAQGPVRATLTMAADDLVSNDLDLFLLDAGGALLQASQGSVATEVIETATAGTFHLGIRAAGGASAYLLSLTPLGELGSLTAPPGAEFVPGEILVKMRPPAAVAAHTDGAKNVPDRVDVVRLAHLPAARERTKFALSQGGDQTLKARTLDEIRRLRRDPAVEYAEPNYLRRPLLLPNDALFDLQWNFPLINLPQAWDRAVGSQEITVAVLDTGILPGHPDLQGRISPGYDFISNPSVANDGDGIDPDPTDPGDDPSGFSSTFHGTHVTGIVAAESDNTIGVAGVTWNARLMPVRVLGVGGGTDADIAQAIRYAAGLENDSGTVPERPADVINMSFGGPSFSQTVADAVQAASNAGSILVAAAGNENNSTPFYPAAYVGVLSVGAVDLASQRAPYSNYGPQLDLVAPGGNSSQDLNADGHFDGILSTFADGNGNFSYRFLSGTSLAAPHVSGIVALMREVNPSLSPLDIERLIAGTHPATDTRITRDLGSSGRDDLYGHGLIDASAALLAAQEVAGGDDEPGSMLALSTTVLDFANYLSSLSFEISNAGSGALDITGISIDQPWLSANPIAGGAPFGVELTANRNGLAQGDYQARVTVSSDAAEGPAEAGVDVFMTVGDVAVGNVGTVFVLLIDEASRQSVAQAETDASLGYAYTLEGVATGTYFIVAGTDRDDDGVICDIEDACGFSAASVTVAAAETLNAADFVIGELATPQESSLSQRVSFENLRRLR